jgi:hypothetical protein
VRADHDSTDGIARDDRDRRGWNRYDLLLAAVPLCFVLGIVAEVVLGLPDRSGVVTASLVAAAVVGDALFRSPPRRA